MSILRKFIFGKNSRRFYCTLSAKEKKMRFAVQLDEDVEKGLFGDLKVRKYPCYLNRTHVVLPQNLEEAALAILKNYKSKTFDEEAQSLTKQIWSRKTPVEGMELKDIVLKARERLVRQGRIPETDDEDEWTKEQKQTLYNTLRRRVYSWKQMEYIIEHKCAVYMASRLAPDYASLFRIFTEIKLKLPQFSPKTLFDFGSGVGSVMWALNGIWPETCKEATFIDSSSAMNDMSKNLQEKGKCNKDSLLTEQATFYRQFLPASVGLTYDFVVSSRTLFDLGEIKERIQTVDILWRKVKPGGCLVLVEAGTFAGYKLLLEARDYLVNINKLESEKSGGQKPFHVVAPCPHEHSCPRYSPEFNRPCNFIVDYWPLNSETVISDVYSYLVVSKTHRPEVALWPKVVEPPLLRGNHRIVRACTPTGSLQEFVVTKRRHGKDLYKICKHTKWGDLFPVKINSIEDDLEEEQSIEGEAVNSDVSIEAPK